MRIVNSIEEANCITHSGTMHADEVFATAFLDFYLDDVRVFRTTNLEGANENALIYDIGRGKFDHHQPDALKRENNVIYSSFGLLWKEFGKDFLKKNGFNDIDNLWNGIDKDLVEGIDGDDNGIFPRIESPYKTKTLPNIIKLFNPSYDSDENETEQFIKAVELAKTIFEEEVYYINGKVKADKKVLKYLEENTNKNYLMLNEYLPYEDVVLSNPLGEKILYVVFPSNRGGYAIKAVPKSQEDKTLKKPFPEEWAGLQNEELEEVSGIKGLRFCHNSRFIINCESTETVNKVLNLVCKEM